MTKGVKLSVNVFFFFVWLSFQTQPCCRYQEALIRVLEGGGGINAGSTGLKVQAEHGEKPQFNQNFF